MKRFLLGCCALSSLFLRAEEGPLFLETSDLAVIRNAAESDKHQFQLIMGILLQYGYGVSQNLEEAARWYLLSAKQGNPRAQKHLGILFILGLGIPQDKVTGMAWILMGSSVSDDYAKEFEFARQEFLEVLTDDEVGQARDLCAQWHQAQLFLRHTICKIPKKKAKNNLLRYISDRPDPQDANERVYGPGTSDWNQGMLRSDWKKMEKEHENFLTTLADVSVQMDQKKLTSIHQQIEVLQAKHGELRWEALMSLLSAIVEAMGSGATIEIPPMAVGAAFFAIENFKQAAEKYHGAVDLNQEIQSLLDLEKHLERDLQRNGRER